jgi:hypothetical protein
MNHTTVLDHDGTLKAGGISWDAAGHAAGTVFFQSNWTQAGTGAAVDPYSTLEFRIARRFFAGGAAPDSTDLSVALADADGNLSASVRLNDYAPLYAPVGEFSPHPIMQTVRIPLADFALAHAFQVRGVRFAFDRTEAGDIYLSDIRFSRPIKPALTGGPAAPSLPALRSAASAAASQEPMHPLVGLGQVAAMRRVPAAGGAVEIELESRLPLPVRDALPVLSIGGRTFKLSRFPNRASTFTIAFTMSRADFDALPQGAEVVVQSGVERWSFGLLDKQLARQGELR